MSAAAATADAAEAAPKKGKKKLIILIAAMVALLGMGGGGAVVYMKKKAAAEAAAAEEDEDGEGADTGHKAVAKESSKKDEKRTPPVFVPLEPFVVNLADREADRFAQVGITLEVADATVGDEIKAYMPAIRNNVLLLLAHKTSQELMEPEGKEELAKEVRREALRPMGIDLPDEEEVSASKKKKKKKPKAEDEDVKELPIKSVQFSSFIIQ
ncbi:MAG TPA: flagellar basal body-associated FliL family protein [Ideonella sp.]|uniref:flagellar basal body-associated FliL family protein n=1 Tax=Ideonella sp. TaxID=1929293 RepID=UPI002E3428E3|nr:flagellar basal body-associated FliL family protein [Ideonella sp.]HEX5685318.1 flagellar basal body-associated FliL family protein [Ideonella sp.]